MGCYDDIEAADAFVLWGSNMAEMHPILWTRVTDRRLSAPHVKVAVLSTFEHRSFELADIPMIFGPRTDLAILNYIANHIIQTGKVNRDFVDEALQLPRRPRPTSATACGPSTCWRRRRRTPPTPPLRRRSTSKNTRSSSAPTRSTTRPSSPACRRSGCEALARALRRSQDQGHVVLDHGVQPARPRRLGQPHGLQHPSADREDRRAGQQPVLADGPALGLRHGARGRHVLAPPARRHAGDQPRAPQEDRGDLEAARGDCCRTSWATMRCSRTAC